MARVKGAGGTDISRAIITACTDIRTGSIARESDIILITDGVDRIAENMVRRYLARINIPVSTPRFTISGAAKDYRVISYTLMLKGYTPLLSQAASNFYSLAARDVPGEDYPRAALYYRRKT